MPNLDDEYHEYLWGEPSPRSFARKAKFGMKQREPRYVVPCGEAIDASTFVSR